MKPGCWAEADCPGGCRAGPGVTCDSQGKGGQASVVDGSERRCQWPPRGLGEEADRVLWRKHVSGRCVKNRAEL